MSQNETWISLVGVNNNNIFISLFALPWKLDFDHVFAPWFLASIDCNPRCHVDFIHNIDSKAQYLRQVSLPILDGRFISYRCNILLCIAILGVRLRSSKTVCSALEENRLGGRRRWGRRRSACTSTILLSPLKRLWGGGCLLHVRVQPHTLIWNGISTSTM